VGRVAVALLDPKLLVVFFVIHHPQNVNNSTRVINAADEPVTVVADVEYHAVADLVSRIEHPLESPNVLPFSGLGWREPRFKSRSACWRSSFRDSQNSISGLP
jgi:hypothetical protein